MIDRGDGLEISLTYSYAGKLPKAPQRRKVVRELLQRAVRALDSKAGVVEGGFAEDSSAKKKTRRDVWIGETGTGAQEGENQ